MNNTNRSVILVADALSIPVFMQTNSQPVRFTAKDEARRFILDMGLRGYSATYEDTKAASRALRRSVYPANANIATKRGTSLKRLAKNLRAQGMAISFV